MVDVMTLGSIEEQREWEKKLVFFFGKIMVLQEIHKGRSGGSGQSMAGMEFLAWRSVGEDLVMDVENYTDM